MRKTNLFKSIACGLVLTAIIGTAVLANVSPRSEVRVHDGDCVLNVQYYYDHYTGMYGTFNLEGKPATTKLSVVNSGGSPRNYYVEAITINNSLGPDRIEDDDYSYSFLTPGSSTSATSTRDYDYPGHKLIHNGKSYYYTNTDSVVIDYYTCTLKHYN